MKKLLPTIKENERLKAELKLVNECWQADIKEIQVLKSGSFMNAAFDSNQNLIAERDALKSINKELLEALENILKEVPRPSLPVTHAIREITISAISKAKL